MSKYTTGEIADLCGITVRTVQYYDKRGILTPSEISEGGRRLYSEDDVSRMRIICFLREIGIGIKEIGDFLDDPSSTEVISLILEEQKKRLVSETREKETQLKKIEELQKGLRNSRRLNDGTFNIDSIGDVVNVMESKSKLRKVRGIMLGVGLPLDIIEIIVIVYGIKTGSWLPAILCLPLIAVVAIFLVKYYYKNALYICPNCHKVFRPGMKEFFFAGHTPTTRKLACPECGETHYCHNCYGYRHQIVEACIREVFECGYAQSCQNINTAGVPWNEFGSTSSCRHWSRDSKSQCDTHKCQTHGSPCSTCCQ